MSLGNKTNVSGNDLLQYWEDDPQTDLILMYLESLQMRAFMQICRRISKRKPLLVVKSGPDIEAGVRAVTSHTGALAAC